VVRRTTKTRENPYVFFFPVPVIVLLKTHSVTRKSTFRYNSMFNFIPVSFCLFFVNFRQGTNDEITLGNNTSKWTKGSMPPVVSVCNIFCAWLLAFRHTTQLTSKRFVNRIAEGVGITPPLLTLALASDVKFHEIFCLEIFLELFHEIFHEIFQKFHNVFFSGFTLTRLTFFVCQTLPFIHLCILQLLKPICWPTCLVCLFK